MKRGYKCIYGDLSLVLIASLGLSLGFAGQAFGQCTNDAGTGDLEENESCALNENDDMVNGGCNSTPDVFTEVPFLPAVYCGVVSNHNNIRTCSETCAMDDDCPDGQTCVDKLCSGPGLDSDCFVGCQEDMDCPDGETCVDSDNDGLADACSGSLASTCDGKFMCVGASEPSVNRRDTDWYLVSHADLALLDLDGNGVVQLTSDVVGEPGLDLVNFMITANFDVTCVNVATPNNTNVSAVMPSVGCWDGSVPCDVDDDCPAGQTCVDGQCSAGPAGGTQSSNVIVLSENLTGVVVFVATGLCSGGGIFGVPNGQSYECSTGINDYILTIAGDPDFEAGDFLGCGDPKQNPLLGPCNEANPGVGGCEDPVCCKIVCGPGGFNPLCCLDVPLGWIQQCADAAISLGCAPEPGGPVCIATGPDNTVDNHLTVCTDPYGSWTTDSGSFGPGDGADNPIWGDDYNPVGAEPAAEASFSNGFFFFVKDAQGVGTHRELLSNIIGWQGAAGLQFGADTTLTRIITSDPPTSPFDDSGDGLFDRLESDFDVFGVGVDVSFHLTQTISQLTPPGGSPVSVVEQTYTVTNNSGAPINFTMLRALDLDLVWAGSGFADDSVGTDTNDNPDLERFVSQGKEGSPETFITISGELGGLYYGSKSGIDPDGAKGPGPAMGAGTDSQQWDFFGVPIGWENYVAGVGADADGQSGPNPLGLGADGSIGLEFPISLAGAGPAVTQVIVVHYTYGAATPLGASIGATCIWDCGGDDDGNVGIVDFLALLGQWTAVGTSCDFDGGGVGIVDFLDLLAHWGPCP